MKENLRSNIFTVLIFILLAFGSLQFVTWISQMAFENTCIELQEQYIGTEVSEVIKIVENAINFGKDLENYYGMDEQLENICQISEGNLKVVVLDGTGKPLYLSFQQKEENKELLAGVYSGEYQNAVAEVMSDKVAGEQIPIGKQQSLVFPVSKQKKQLIGHLCVIYEQKNLVSENDASDIRNKKLFILGIVSLMLFLFFICHKRGTAKKWYICYMPVIFIMTGMFSYILFLYHTYQGKYNTMISDNAGSAAEYIQKSIDDLLEKGMPIGQIEQVGDYLIQKVEGNAAIGGITVVKKYFDTNDILKNAETNVLYLEVADGQAVIEVSVSKSYIDGKIQLMLLTFGAIFVICLMITYELTHLADVVAGRISPDFNRETPEQLMGMGGMIKLLSFLSYTAIYTSMPYAAVIMRNWDVAVFGMSKSVSASLPLTIELLCIMLSSFLIQKVFQDTKMNRLVFFVFPFLILGNMACMAVFSPYLLIGLRAFCGIGFAFLKYFLNSLVAAGSLDSAAISRNYAQLNAGLLGGITVGASLGSILAQSMGYQFNYFFTALICVCLIVLTLLFVPWKMLNARRAQAVQKSSKASAGIKEVLKNPTVRKVIILGDIPLNIGLMYVVSFLPVYMNNVGQSAVATSYAYLINGLAGVYIGVVLMNILKKLSGEASFVVAMVLGTAGILVLLVDSGIGVILVSAGIMGLFDGFGTPAITGFFTGLPAVQKADTASMLTVFNSVGSAVQIVCPMLYNLLIQPDGKTTYLLLFGIGYAVVTVLFFFAFRSGAVH